jgi:integrase
VKLIDREKVPGTTAPVIYFGHRSYRARNGSQRAAKVWYAEYCLHGKQKHESLDTRNKTSAIKAAHKLAIRIQNDEPDRARRRIDLEQVTKQYMDYQRNCGRAPKTIEKYEYVLGTLATWAKDHDRSSASTFAAKDFWAFNGWMEKEKLGKKTCADRLIIVKQLFKWAAGRGQLIARNPVAEESVPNVESKIQPCFTPEQVGTLLDRAEPHEAGIYSLMAYAGLRFGEVQQLTWADLVLNNDGTGFIIVQRGGANGTTKGKRSRRIPIKSELRRVFDELPRTFTTVFSARASKKYPEGGGVINERRLLVSLKRLCKRCEFVDPDQYKLHTFRHAFASMLARSTTSYKYALEFMGHKSSDILDLYYKMYDATAQTAIQTLIYPRAIKLKQAPAA